MEPAILAPRAAARGGGATARRWFVEVNEVVKVAVPAADARKYMHLRSRYRMRPVTMALASLSVLPLFALVATGGVGSWLRELTALPTWAFAVAAVIPPLLIWTWYMLSFVELRTGQLVCRGLNRARIVDLRLLVEVEVAPRSRGVTAGSGRTRTAPLVLVLRDADGMEVALPLASWRDEDLLLAAVLRHAVDRRVRVGGDPQCLRELDGMLRSHRGAHLREAA